MVIKIILGAFVISWVGIIYSMITAPLVDENGNIIKEEDKQKKFAEDEQQKLNDEKESKR